MLMIRQLVCSATRKAWDPAGQSILCAHWYRGACARLPWGRHSCVNPTIPFYRGKAVSPMDRLFIKNGKTGTEQNVRWEKVENQNLA